MIVLISDILVHVIWKFTNSGIFFCSDSVVSVHNLETFAHKFTLHKTKGASVFAVDIKVRFSNKLVLSTELIINYKNKM